MGIVILIFLSLADGIGTFETILGQLYPEAKLKF